MLGRGLSSLIPPKKDQPETVPLKAPEFTMREVGAGGRMVLEISVEHIRPNPRQPRQSFGHEDMEDLVNSIRVHGILQPLVVSDLGDGTYELIAGERRLRAAKIAGLATVPVVTRSVREHEKLELALIENIQRKNLNPIEEAHAYEKLVNEFNLTQEEVARRVGKSRPVVANTLRLLNLPEDIQRAVVDGKIFASQARLIAGIDNSRDQRALFRKFIRGVSLRESEREVKKIRARRGKLSPQDVILASKEAELRQALGTKVEIKKKGEQGNITIHFYSEEELNELLKKLTK